jgi:hypothetical protein
VKGIVDVVCDIVGHRDPGDHAAEDQNDTINNHNTKDHKKPRPVIAEPHSTPTAISTLKINFNSYLSKKRRT